MRAVNLLPPELRTASRRGRSPITKAVVADAPGGSAPFFVLGALALCLLGVVAYVLAANTVTERRAELAQVSAEHRAAASRAAALKPYGDFQAMAIQRTETVTSLAAGRFDWEQALRDVARALPGTVTLSSLDGSISTETGASGSQLRGEIPSPAITLKGCSRSQAAVATMMSRVRGVRGVTRVTLSKSARVQAAAASAGTSAGPCGAGSPPQFEAVVFFERSSAGAAPSAGATVGAPPAPGSPAPASGSATPADPAQPAVATPTPASTPTP